MITLIIPTHNRAHTLRHVVGSYYEQRSLSEIVFVLDACTDESRKLISEIAAQYPHIRTVITENPERKGAAHSRNVGIKLATQEFVLFCDDDEYLEPEYAAACLERLTGRVGAVSGRRIYMQSGDTPAVALKRFGNGLRRSSPFNYLICEYVNGARFEGDRLQPFTNAVILTRRELLLRYGFDPFYSKGNGYREETDFQMKLFTSGYDVLVTNKVHSFHLPNAMVRTGGQRTYRWRRIYWSIYYTAYFFRKYHADYARATGIVWPRWFAMAAFATFAVYRETVRPTLHAIAMKLIVRPMDRQSSIKV